MDIPLLFGSYLAWHYAEAPKDIARITGNYVWFFFNMFSVGLLLRTLFAPFKRIQEERRPGFDPGEFFSRIIVNLMTRLVGAVVRTLLIAVGCLLMALTFVAGAAVLVIWLFLPFLIVFLFSFGVWELFSFAFYRP